MSTIARDRTTIQGVSPYLYYECLDEALEWLESAFGFAEDVRYVDSDGIVQEAEMFAGETRIMMGGCAPGPNDGPGQLLIVFVEDIDEQYRRLTEAGLEAEPPTSQPYGPRTCSAIDPWGYKWSFWQQTGNPIQLPDGWSEIRP